MEKIRSVFSGEFLAPDECTGINCDICEIIDDI